MANVRSISAEADGTIYVEIEKDGGGIHRLSIEPGADVAARIASVAGLRDEAKTAITSATVPSQTPQAIVAYKATQAAAIVPPGPGKGEDQAMKRIAAIEARLAKAGIA